MTSATCGIAMAIAQSTITANPPNHRTPSNEDDPANCGAFSAIVSAYFPRDHFVKDVIQRRVRLSERSLGCAHLLQAMVGDERIHAPAQACAKASTI